MSLGVSSAFVAFLLASSASALSIDRRATCSPLVIQDFSSSSQKNTNKLGGWSDTDGTGSLSVKNGVETWKPKVGGYWYSVLSSSNADCRDLSSFGSGVAYQLTIAKTSSAAATLEIGADVGCSSTTYHTLGTIDFPAGSSTKTVTFKLSPTLSSTDLKSVNSISLSDAGLPSGAVFTLDDIQVVCTGSTPTSPSPSPASSPKVSQSPSPSPKVSQSPSPSPKASASPSPSPKVSPSPSPSTAPAYCKADNGIDGPDPFPENEANSKSPKVVGHCKTPGHYALTFDDGPYLYESDLLDILAKNGIKATFFLNSNNWVDASLPENAAVVKKIFDAGHQIASHTATHRDLVTLTDAQITAEFSNHETVINNIIKKKPAMLRPPYGSYNDKVLQLAKNFGYTTVALWNFDDQLWNHLNPQTSMDMLKGAIETKCKVKGSAGVLHLAHSVQEQVLSFATTAIPYIQSRGYKFVTVSECVGMPAYK